jgi:hypothetical protein
MLKLKFLIMVILLSLPMKAQGQWWEPPYYRVLSSWGLSGHIYKDPAGTIQRIYQTSASSPWFTDQLNNNGLTSAPIAISDPTNGSMYSSTYRSNYVWETIEYLYLSEGGSINRVYWREDTKLFYNDTLNNGGRTTAPPAAILPWVPRDYPEGGRNYVYTDTAGNVIHIWSSTTDVDSTHSYRQINNGGVTNTPPAAGRPSFLRPYIPIGKYYSTDFFFRDQQGFIQHVYFANNVWRNDVINGGRSTNAPLAVGDPVTMNCIVKPGNWTILDCVYLDVNGGISHVYWTNGVWKAEQLNGGKNTSVTSAPAAGGNPSSLNTTLPGVGFVLDYVYRDVDGNLQHIYWLNNAWKTEKLNNGGVTNAPLASSDPSSWAGWGLDYSYTDNFGNIIHIFWRNNTWNWEKLNNSGITNMPPSTGMVRGSTVGKTVVMTNL